LPRGCHSRIKIKKNLTARRSRHRAAKAAKTQKNKMCPDFRRLAREYKFDLNTKPTQLLFEQWLRLFNYFLSSVSEDKKRNTQGTWEHLSLQQQTLIKRHRTTVT